MSDDKKISSVGIIMDGNRRWAKERGLPIIEGHRRGADVIENIAKGVKKLKKEYGLAYVTLYTFSTENWNRAPDEVEYLMDLIRTRFPRLGDTYAAEGIRIRIIGERHRFDSDIQDIFNRLEAQTEHHTEFTVAFALSYGGRAEIVAAVNTLIAAGNPVSEDDISQSLWTVGIPDPDIIIRTSGEQRLSGFLPWQGVYSELFFTKTFWPDFNVEEFMSVLDAYLMRQRRHGK